MKYILKYNEIEKIIFVQIFCNFTVFFLDISVEDLKDGLKIPPAFIMTSYVLVWGFQCFSRSEHKPLVVRIIYPLLFRRHKTLIPPEVMNINAFTF